MSLWLLYGLISLAEPITVIVTVAVTVVDFHALCKLHEASCTVAGAAINGAVVLLCHAKAGVVSCFTANSPSGGR